MGDKPFARITGPGIDVMIQVNDSDDAEIVRLAVAMVERRNAKHKEKNDGNA